MIGKFELLHKDKNTKARLGKLYLNHGKINTPVFMPVGTQATVKSLTPEDLYDIGFEIILSNSYHLYLRPGTKVIKQFEGIHKFMNWEKNILTDSGGFQIFSLTDLVKLDKNGVKFKSHIDGSNLYLTPEDVVEMQEIYNSDIAMVLDVCTKIPSSKSEALAALKITYEWAKRCKVHHKLKTQLQFGIVQGNIFKDLRKKSSEQLVDLDFPGYAIGGLSVGEKLEIRNEVLDYSIPWLPENKPRYLMGVGTPQDILYGVSFGIDMFDCVLPTRNARNGHVFTDDGHINIKNKRFEFDETPIEKKCKCYTCKNYSKSYLRHLFKAKELLALRLNSIHNLHYLNNLIKEIRYNIKKDDFEKYKNDKLKQLFGGKNKNG